MRRKLKENILSATPTQIPEVSEATNGTGPPNDQTQLEVVKTITDTIKGQDKVVVEQYINGVDRKEDKSFDIIHENVILVMFLITVA